MVTTQETVTDSWLLANCRIRTIPQFEIDDDRGHYDRIIYQIGNSEFHAHMFELVKRRSGVVTLHDVFLGGLQHWRGSHHAHPHLFARELVTSHGYSALIDHLQGQWDTAIWKYPCNTSITDNAAGLIVHSRQNADALKSRFGFAGSREVRVIPHLRSVPRANRAAAREELGLRGNEFVVCSFGFVAKNKLSQVVLAGFSTSQLANDSRCMLFFVGDNTGEYGLSISQAIEMTGLSDRVKITGFVDTQLYRTYLAAADVAVQLRALSRGETSGAVLDCAAYGVPLIINAHGTMAEVSPETCVKLPDKVVVADVAAALDLFRKFPDVRHDLASKALDSIRQNNSPSTVGREYCHAVESFAIDHRISRERKIVAAIMRQSLDDAVSAADLAAVAGAMSRNRSVAGGARLFLDVSELARRDWKSGIQRVVRAVVAHLLGQPPIGWSVQLVYLDQSDANTVYRYARRFTSQFVGYTDSDVEDEIAEPTNGDSFLGLDLFPKGVVHAAKIGLYTQWRARGVAVYFVVYDLIPVLAPTYFVDGAYETFAPWLDAVAAESDGIVCISKTVSEEFLRWLETTSSQRLNPLKIGYFHLGSDGPAHCIQHSAGQLPAELIALFDKRPTALMVGTLEPRKGYEDVLTAFEILWARGVAANLFIVGKEGWLAEQLVARLTSHREAEKRLFWRPYVSDSDLEDIYRACSGLIAASYAEGFGLPLIEAAEHGLPIFARDIPVFREVAGAHAEFFVNSDVDAMTESLHRWLGRLACGTATSSRALPRQDWAQASEQLVSVVLRGNWLTKWSGVDSCVYRGEKRPF